MIRKLENADIETVIKIWLDASIIAHNFMDAAYWQSKTNEMRNIYLPSAETHVYEDSGKILGFISMLGNFVAAVFVLPEFQGKGIGSQLMDFVKSKYKTIELAVYKENKRSVEFYQKQDFRIISEGVEKHTGHPELIMIYEKLNRPQNL